MINEVPMTLIGKPTLPANNYAELLKWMEANKGKINLANAGLGAASHLCGLLLQSTLKIDMQTVPYKGTAPAMNDLLGGQVDIMCDQTTNTTGQIEAGKVKAYAVTSTKRLTTPALKNLPTLDEAGLKGFNVNIWHGVYAPKGTAKAVTDKINAALRTALKDPDFIKRGDHHRRPPRRRRAQEVRRRRDRQVEPGDQGGRPIRRLNDAGARTHARSVIGIVTGPSLTRLTCMSAPNSPLATSPCSRRAVASARS
jgi:tripartite-type tricarboxylate transporter receptor subunit TctC